MNHSAHQKTFESASRQKYRQLEQNRERFKQKVQQPKPRTDHTAPNITTHNNRRPGAGETPA
ncbi:hypothetical protein [Lentibacillus sp.]|uniref:hypothetical protein n=1 Tax=Lentibacillus sp. TaxID=1925746 RepID=UPI002B4B0F98|nr:hypothetical protein [Lentibacillus sp.]HLS08877.1 hypothetical protein [Lentibacillus sp.]